jgi:hypothetical protein
MIRERIKESGNQGIRLMLSMRIISMNVLSSQHSSQKIKENQRKLKKCSWVKDHQRFKSKRKRR